MTGRLILEVANVAVSAEPLGTVAGVQLLAVFQSILAGVAFQVALPAKLLLAVANRSVRRAAAEGRKADARGRRNDDMQQTKNTKLFLAFILVFYVALVV
jgi:hypothetical protein